jgi:hypothetical protein
VRTPTRRSLGIAATIAAVSVAGVTHAQDTPPAPPPDMILSDEFKLSRWAYPTRAAKVRIAPSPRATSFARLRFMTEDDYPELYLLLSRHIAANGEAWVRIRVPGRPNGRAGWVPRAALGEYHIVRTSVLVNRKTLHATLYRNGRRIFRAPIGVGKLGTPTPGGRFYVREKFIVPGDGSGLYGTRAIGTSAYAPTLSDWPNGGVVGLHGTGKPHLIPGRPSHGCVRLRNRDIERLYRLLPRGTPVRII